SGRRLARLAQRLGLRLAARLCQGGGEIGEEQGQNQPEVQGEQVRERHRAGIVEDQSNGVQQRQKRAYLHHEHHRVLPLDVRTEHDKGLLQGGLEQLWLEQASCPRGPAIELQFLRRELRLRWCAFQCLLHGYPHRRPLAVNQRLCQPPNGIGPRCSAT